jgi:glucan phosphoethanolaminetransferase (alkaline phosphatase superfamily)
MSAGPNFCSNCGERLDSSVSIEECPKCHTPLHEHSKHIEPTPSVIEQLPYKSPGTAALIAFIGGIFALPGIGHIYVGKVGRGIGILVLGLILYALTVISIFSVGFLAGFEQPNVASDSASAGLGAIAIMLVLSFVYIILFIWQIFNARKLAKKFNEAVKTTGKEPW